MTNHFEKHDVMHLSPSMLNLWISQPAMALMRIAGIRDNEAGPAAWRGNAVDRMSASAAFYPDRDIEQLTQTALEIFDDELDGSSQDHFEKKVLQEREAIPAYLEQAVDFYRSLGETPEESQGKVTCMLDDIPVPMLGYFDLLYADKVRDTKTVGRMVSKLTDAHARQASFYAYATNREPWIDYVGKKEVRAYKVPTPEFWNKQNILAAKTLERVLAHSDDIFECCQLVFPDLDHWMWGETTKTAAKAIWQMED